MAKHYANPPQETRETPALKTRTHAPSQQKASQQEGPYMLAYAPRSFEPLDDGHRPHAGRFVAFALILLLVALGIAGVGAYRSAMQIKEQAGSAMSVARSLEGSIKDGDVVAIKTAASDISVSAHKIQDQMASPLWKVAAALPVVGQDVSSAMTIADVAVDLADNALLPLSADSGILNLGNMLQDGAINVEALQGMSAALATAAPVIERSAAAVSELPPSQFEQVEGYLGKFREAIGQADEMVRAASDVLPYLPAMLGANGQVRNYLVVAQNNAEARATGGFPGSWGLLTVSDGKIEMGESATLQGEREVLFSLTEDEMATWGVGMAQSPGNLNVTPNFVRAGQLLGEAYTAYTGQPVDGVIAIDPVFLQSMLALTGGIEAYDGTVIDGTNAAEVLLSDVYWMFGNDGESQDYYFAHVAGLAASRLTSGLGEVGMTSLMSSLADAGKSHHLQVWMASEAEEDLMVRLGYGGELSQDPANPVLGVYVNDDTWAKITWYLGVTTEVGEAQANEDGTVSYAVTTTLTNHLTPEEAYDAPRYVTGSSPAKRSVSDMNENLLLLAPAGGSVTDVETSVYGEGKDVSLYGLGGHMVNVRLAAEEQVLVSYRVTVAPGASPLVVRTTPLGRTF